MNLSNVKGNSKIINLLVSYWLQRTDSRRHDKRVGRELGNLQVIESGEQLVSRYKNSIILYHDHPVLLEHLRHIFNLVVDQPERDGGNILQEDPAFGIVRTSNLVPLTACAIRLIG